MVTTLWVVLSLVTAAVASFAVRHRPPKKSWYNFLCEWQTAISAIVGFAGVIATIQITNITRLDEATRYREQVLRTPFEQPLQQLAGIVVNIPELKRRNGVAHAIFTRMGVVSLNNDVQSSDIENLCQDKRDLYVILIQIRELLEKYRIAQDCGALQSSLREISYIQNALNGYSSYALASKELKSLLAGTVLLLDNSKEAISQIMQLQSGNDYEALSDYLQSMNRRTNSYLSCLQAVALTISDNLITVIMGGRWPIPSCHSALAHERDIEQVIQYLSKG